MALMAYETTEEFPKKEIFGLVSRMRRCAVLITSNIAEGFSRQYYKEKTQFYSIAHSSVTELQNQCIIARDAGCISKDKFLTAAEQSIKVHKIISGLIKKSKIIHNS